MTTGYNAGILGNEEVQKERAIGNACIFSVSFNYKFFGKSTFEQGF